jgi:hypothetical protein
VAATMNACCGLSPTRLTILRKSTQSFVQMRQQSLGCAVWLWGANSQLFDESWIFGPAGDEF